jgi:hypothetical protein
MNIKDNTIHSSHKAILDPLWIFVMYVTATYQVEETFAEYVWGFV